MLSEWNNKRRRVVRHVLFNHTVSNFTCYYDYWDKKKDVCTHTHTFEEEEWILSYRHRIQCNKSTTTTNSVQSSHWRFEALNMGQMNNKIRTNNKTKHTQKKRLFLLFLALNVYFLVFSRYKIDFFFSNSIVAPQSRYLYHSVIFFNHSIDLIMGFSCCLCCLRWLGIFVCELFYSLFSVYAALAR